MIMGSIIRHGLAAINTTRRARSQEESWGKTKLGPWSTMRGAGEAGGWDTGLPFPLLTDIVQTRLTCHLRSYSYKRSDYNQ